MGRRKKKELDGFVINDEFISILLTLNADDAVDVFKAIMSYVNNEPYRSCDKKLEVFASLCRIINQYNRMPRFNGMPRDESMIADWDDDAAWRQLVRGMEQ